MKQFKKSSEQKQKQEKIPKSKIKAPGKGNIIKQIEKLQRQIQSTNQDIKNTQKKLDVDLFLKQQKQKRLEYAKNLNSDYEAQKKQRQAKLYKKFNREQKEGTKQQNQDRIQFKTQNIPLINPLIIIKSLVNSKLQDEWVKDGHHYKPDEIQIQGLREKQQELFKTYYKNPNQKPKYDGDTQGEHVVWKNVKQVAQNSLQMITLPHQIKQNSLIPNDDDSQNILSAIALINKKICDKTFAQNDNIFMAQLFAPNGEVTVVVDKKILVRQFTHKNVNLGSRSYDKNQLWPTLIQKCFEKLKLAKQMNHLSNSINKTMYTIYGIDPQLIAISNINIIKQNFCLVLAHLLQEGRVGFINFNGHSKKPYENRIYILQQIREQVIKTAKQQKKEVKLKIKNPWRGKLIDSQNINRFTVLQLLELFNCVIILRDYPKRWACLRISVSYFSNGSVGVTGNQWTKNPQYLFTITKDTFVRIILRKSGTIQSFQNQPQKDGVYGFLLFENKQHTNKIEAMKMDWLISKTKSTDLNQASFSSILQKGNYILIPYSTLLSEKNYQFYELDFFIEKQDNIDFGKARFFDFNYVTQKGSRLNNDNNKIIQSLQSVQKFSKPKIDKIDIVSQFSPTISEKILQSLDLNLYKNVTLKHFYVPGFISNLLINKEVEVQIKQNKQKKIKDEKLTKNEELTQQQKAENLHVLLGYDVFNDQINQGLMKDQMEQSVGKYDFRSYGLGQEGLTAVLEAISQHPQIIQIDLTDNDLNDMSITFLCYYMEKANRTELRKLKIQNNKYGNIGKRALKGLKSTFPKLQIVGPIQS